MAWAMNKVFNESYENYGSMNKAYELFHDMKKKGYDIL